MHESELRRQEAAEEKQGLAEQPDLPDTVTDRYIDSGFRKDIEGLLNKHSMENGSDTPDFILAEYLTDCLKAWDRAMFDRTNWYSPRDEKPAPHAGEATT